MNVDPYVAVTLLDWFDAKIAELIAERDMEARKPRRD